MSGTKETRSMAPFSPGAAGSKKDKNGRESPDSVASDATPVTNNAAAPKKKKSDLHSLWEYRATSLTGNDPGSPPTTVRTTTSKASPRVVSPVASASSSPGSPVNEQAATDNELALPKKELGAIEAKKIATKFSSSSLNVQPRNVKKEAKKFEVGKSKTDDELTLLKKELETLQGKSEESKKDTPPLQKKKSYLFWEQKTKNILPLAKNENASFSETVSAELPGDDGVISDAFTGGAVAVTAAAATKGTPAATIAGEGSMPSEDKSFDNDSITSGDTAQLMSEFRALVEKLVRKAMPSEIDHVDELIAEYDGREEELLEILSAMQEEVDRESASNEKESAAAVMAGAATVATAAVVNGSQDEQAGLGNVGSFESDVHVYEDDETSASFETADQQKVVADASVKSDDTVHTSNKSVNTNSVKGDDDNNGDDANDDSLSQEDYDSVVSRTTPDIGNVIVENPYEQNSDVEKGEVAAATMTKSERESCWKRNKAALLTLVVVVLLSGAGAAIGILLSSPPGKDKNDTNIIFDEPIGTGRPLPETEGDLSPGIILDNVDMPPTVEDDLSTFCYNELPLTPGIGQLRGNNPLVAVDGTNAVIVTGSGYVSFYSLQSTTWQRGETFGILAAHGDIASVSISGNTAVIGLPKAAIAVGPSGPVATGMIVTYERNSGSGRWRQSKELVPDEYREGALRYRNSDFGQSVSIYNDLVVVGAPSEETNSGSITVFKKEGKGSWNQVIKLARGAGMCQNEDDIFLGYYVNVYQNTIAASADCAENIVLYEYDRTDSIVKSSQVLEWIDRKFGAVASIGMTGEYLIYSTVGGGLFIFHRKGGSEFILSQDLTFNNKLGLFEYPVAISANLFALAVGNKFQIYTQAEQGAQWKREPVTLVSDGDFEAYVKPGLAVSNGNILLGSNTNIESYDLSQCVPEMVIHEVVVSETSCVVVNVTLDDYPNDTSWKIEDSEGNTFASSSPYDKSMATKTQVDEVCDLSDGRYTFVIFDEYGDGMCCKWNYGSYSLSTKDGLVIVSGGEFGSSEKTLFSIPFAGDSTVTKPIPNEQTTSPTKQPSLVPTTMKLSPTPTTPPRTSEPTDAPVTATPTTPPVTNDPTDAPLTATPTTTPRTSEPTDAPLTATPTTPPVTNEPTDAPLTATPTTPPVTNEPTDAPLTATPTTAPVTNDPTDAPLTATPTTAPVTNDPTEQPTLNPTTQTPVQPLCTTIEISITLDDYPQDTSWNVVNSTGEVVAKSPPYDDSMKGLTKIESLCLQADSYSFDIYDDYEDGLCCSWGIGSYTLTSADGEILATGGEWLGPSETKTFQLP